MPRLSQLQERFRRTVARRAALALVPLALVAPRTGLALPPGSGTMPSVSLQHDGNGTASVNTNSSSSTTFTLTSLSVSTMTVNLVVTVCSGNLAPGSCTRSPTSVSLPSGASTGITVNFTGGTAGGTGTITLTAKNTSGSTLSSASVTVTVAQPLPTATINSAAHLGDRRDVSVCVADCFESTLSYSTPAYTSLDIPRSVTLLYRSGRAYPYGTVTLDVTDPYATATKFKLKLKDANGAYVTFSKPGGPQELYFARNTTGPTRIVAQFLATSIPTSAALYTAEVTMIWPSGTQGTAAATVRIIILNDMASPLGAGVDVVGLQRIFNNQAGGVLVTDGTGSASFFTGNCSPSVACTFTSPAGDFSTLTTGSGFYKRTTPDGTVVTFNSTRQETSVADRFGTTTQIAWVLSPQLGVYVPTAITDPTGQVIALNYRDAANAGTSYLVGSMGQILIQGGLRVANFGVLPSGNLEHFVDADNVCCDVASYDAQHRLTQFTSKVGAVTNYAYRYGATLDSTQAPPVVLAGGTTARPRTMLRNAADALLVGAAVGGGTSGSPLAVPSDLRASVTDPAGNITYYSLSRFGSPTKTKAPLIPADSVEYDPATGLVLRTISPTGHEVRYTYYSSHFLESVYDVTLAKADTISYAPQYWLPYSIVGSSGQQWFTYYTDKAGWPLKTMSPVQYVSLTTHYPDSYGRDTAVVDPALHRTSYTYASTGLRNLQSFRGPTGLVTTIKQDAAGRDTMITDPSGNVTKQQFNMLNTTASTVGAQSDTTKFYYNTVSADTAIIDAKGRTFKFVRNALGWVTTQVTPGSGTDSIFYDIAGRVARTRSRGGAEVQFTYDSLSRLVKRVGVATQSVDSMWYDPNGKWVAAQNRIGTNLGTATIISTDTILVDEQNRLSKSMTNRSTIGAWRVQKAFLAADPGLSSVYVYKRVNNTDNRVAFTEYHYWDAQKRLTTMQSHADTANFFYNGESLVDSVSLRTGLTESYTYTWTHELSTRGYTGASWVDNLLKRWYRTDSLQQIAERGGPDSLFQAFSYDSTGRLRTWAKKALRTGVTCINAANEFGYTCSGAAPWVFSQVSPTYDKVGNPTDLGAVATAGNRLTSFNGVTMTYSADGEMRTRVTATTADSLGWDEFGRLRAIYRAGQATSFQYDGFGRRVRKTSPSGAVVEYLWDGNQIVVETDGSGNVKRTYTYYPGIDRPRSVTYSGETYFFSTEADGTINGLIRKSDRTVVAQYGYTPWGELETAAQPSDSVSNLRWKGLPYDKETGLYYVRARYYDPKTRRFMSEDPIGLAGGINQYTFGANDPVNHSDPSGMDWVCSTRWVEDGYSYLESRPEDSWGFGHYETVCWDDSGSTVDPITRQRDLESASGGAAGGSSSANTLLTRADTLERVDELEKELTGEWMAAIRTAVVSEALGAAALAGRGKAALERLAVRTQLQLLRKPITSWSLGFSAGVAVGSLHGVSSRQLPQPWFPDKAMSKGYSTGKVVGSIIKHVNGH